MRVGVIGGGQLARMMVPPAIALGVEIRVLAESEDSSARIATTAIGDYRDVATVLAFATDVDVVTFDHEHVPHEVLERLEDSNVLMRPGREALRSAQDKIQMRKRLAVLGVPMPDWAVVSDGAQLDAFLATHGGVAVVKTPRGGYDGKGVRVVHSAAAAADWLAEGEVLAEELVDFRRELAQQIVRRPSGHLAVWPLVETIQRDGMCVEVLAPAPQAARAADEARGIAETIASGLGVTGALAVELFEAQDGRLLVNELAMRPHNSGHWTIDGAVTGQFEQHLRGVLDLPLGDPAPIAPVSVMVNVLGGPPGATMPDRYPSAFAAHPDVKFHSYGKASRPGRKVGHVTAIGTDLAEVRARARAAAGFFQA